MKYYTIVYPGEFGQLVKETFSEDQIIKSYYRYWITKMIKANKYDMISRELCIDDWISLHWAMETDQFGNKLN